MEKLAAVTVLLILAVGFLQRRRPGRHIPLMAGAIAIDFALVVYLEINRHVVHESATRMDALLAFHIATAAIVLLMYIALVGSGAWAFWKGGRSIGHKWMGPMCIALRVVTFITSFGVVKGG